ncbi:MAG: hypothetical protein LBN43_07420 [Oscillospiraceae bacterium]|jgi:hypothetical protein|nr:hypothetical protein [Oscillospiraceae bacterium]
MKKIIIIAVFVLLTLSACSGTLDVVGQQASVSFDEVLNIIPARLRENETNNGWSLNSPDGAIWFIWSGDSDKSPRRDVMFEMHPGAFYNAGLDDSKLPDNYLIDDAGMLTIGAKLGDKKLAPEGEATPLAAFEQIVKNYRSAIGYHTEMDHFNVDLGGGNMFEWAKDMNTNDKDVVFALNPEPFIAAGVDPENVEGWSYAPVTVTIDGRPTQIWKFLKAYDLK